MDLHELKKKLAAADISFNEVALKAGVSKATVSGALSDKANVKPGTQRKVEEAAICLLQRKRDGEVSTIPEVEPEGQNGLFLTEGQRVAQVVLTYTLEDREFSLLTGFSGAGKSFISEHFRQQHDGVLLCQMQDAMSYGDILSLLLESMGQSATGTNYKKFRKLMAAVRNYRMLIVDEADLFCKGAPSAFLKKISIFRQCFEQGVAVCLVGLPELEEKLREAGETYIYSRIGYQRRLKNVTPEEMTDFWAHLGGDLTDEVADVIRMAAARAYLRTLKKVYARTQRVGLHQARGLIFDA